MTSAKNLDSLTDDVYLLRVMSLPAPLKYAHIVYQKLLADSEPEEITIPLIADAVSVPVFRGNLTEIFKASGASNAYYSAIRKTLIDCGSIHILERGTIHSPSVVVVTDTLPPLTPLEAANVKSPSEVLTESSDAFTMLSRRVQAIEERLAGLNVTEAIGNHEQRLAKLEGSPNKDSVVATKPTSR